MAMGRMTATPAGEAAFEMMDAKGIGLDELAGMAGMGQARLREILRGGRPSREEAGAIGRALGGSAGFWMMLADIPGDGKGEDGKWTMA